MAGRRGDRITTELRICAEKTGVLPHGGRWQRNVTITGGGAMLLFFFPLLFFTLIYYIFLTMGGVLVAGPDKGGVGGCIVVPGPRVWKADVGQVVLWALWVVIWTVRVLRPGDRCPIRRGIGRAGVRRSPQLWLWLRF